MRPHLCNREQADINQLDVKLQPVGDGDSFLVSDTCDELVEPFACDGGNLLDKDLGLLIIKESVRLRPLTRRWGCTKLVRGQK